MTKLTITLRYTLEELKELYIEYFNLPKSAKITKSQISLWLSNLVEADIQ